MIPILIRFISALIFWGIFIYVVLQVPYPKSLTTASLFQILAFFIPLLLAIALTLNLAAKNIFISVSISLGLLLLLLLKALDSLNPVTLILIIVAVGLLVSYFKKNKQSLGIRRIKSIRV